MMTSAHTTSASRFDWTGEPVAVGAARFLA
jgi:hypothetical protein